MDLTLGTILKSIREENNISRVELSSKLNISYSALQHWENDRRDISLFMLSNILHLLNAKLSVKNNSIEIKSFTSSLTYNINYFKETSIDFVYQYDNYGIIKNNDNSSNKTTYSIIHIYALTTPYSLKLNYNSLVDAKMELHKYVDNLKFSILSEVTIDTSGKLLFREQISKLLTKIGLENARDIIKDIGKRKINGSIEKIQNQCILVYGEVDGLELSDIILNAISKCYKKVLLDDIIKGYDGFLKALTISTNGALQNIHQKHALLNILDIKNKYDNSIYLSSYKDYDNAILDIINQDIYKYGYPSFYKNVVTAIDKHKQQYTI